MKVYKIEGNLTVHNDSISHQELLYILFTELAKMNVHFSGMTKEINNKDRCITQ